MTAIAGTCILAVGPAALAQPSLQSPEGIALQVTGATPVGPFAESMEPTPTSATAVGVNVDLGTLALFGVGDTSDSALTSSVTLNSATASVDTLSSSLLTLTGGSITANAVTSSCTVNSDGTFTESTSVADLDVFGVIVAADPNVPVDDVLTGLSGLPTGFSITVELNQVEPNEPGSNSETVNGVFISVTDSLLSLTENIYIASSTCGPYNSAVGTPLASGKGLAAGLGLLGLLGLGYGAIYIRRRHSQSLAA
jgi:hypothetical protein